MKKTLTIFLFSCLFFIVQATESHTVSTTAGNLATNAITYLTTVTNLTVTGTIDARDFKTMRDDMPLLAVLDLSGATIAAYTGEGTNGSTTYPVNEIPQYAFCTTSSLSKASLTSITMPSSLTSIGAFSFSGCFGFTGSLTIPSSVIFIGANAFIGCSGFTGTLTIPSSVISIGTNAFNGCRSFTGPLIIPPLVTSIGINAFRGCSGFTGSLTIPSSVISIGASAFFSCSGFTGSLVLPSSVISIGSSAFYGCGGFTGSLTIPSSVTSIGASAFMGCNGFTGSLTIPSSVISIGASAFSACTGFTGSLIIPSSVTSIGANAFSSCSSFTGSLTVPSSVTSIGASAFSNCRGFTGSLTIPSSVISIGSSAFSDCNGFTGSLTIPSSVTSVGDFAFKSCSGFTGSLTIPSSVTSIGNAAFFGCSGFTGSLTIPSSIMLIGNYTFRDCTGFTGSLTIPASVTSIGASAFSGCSNLSSIKAYGTTPGSITLGSNAFYGIPVSACKLYVPVGAKALYAAAPQWSAFTDIIEFPVNITTPGTLGTILTAAQLSTLTNLTVTGTIDARDFKTMRDNMPLLAVLDLSEATIAEYTGAATNGSTTYPANEIPQYAFCTDNMGKVSLTSITMPSSVTSIGASAFFCCRGFIGSLTIPTSVTSIGTDAFAGFAGFTGSLIIPLSVTSIGASAFTACSGFTGSLTIPSSVISIGSSAFSGCSGFTGDLIIPSSVTSIENSTFTSCIGFTGLLTIPSSVISIGDNAFFSCIGFTGSLVLPSSVMSIGSSAFLGCRGFTGSLILPSSVISIGTNAFSDCIGFTGSLTIPSTVTSIRVGAFNNCSGFTGSLILPSSVTSIESSAFSGCSGFTGSLILPSSVTLIRYNAFKNCRGFKGPLTIPSSVTSIEDQAFYGCRGFTGSLTIPSSVTSIGNNAFSGWSNLSSIKAYGTTPGSITLGSNVFYGIPVSACKLYVPVDAAALYAAAPQWKAFMITEGFAPTITTQAVSSITAATAIGNGNITDLGVPNPTAYGVCWNTTGTPTISDSKVDNGAISITGVFTAAMAGLTANTTYYVRAFATNSAGTSYGTEVSFTTNYASQVITFNSLPTKTYGDVAYSLAATSTSGLAVSYASDNTAVATVSGNTLTIVGAGTANITASQAGDATYAAAPSVTQRLTINKKVLTITDPKVITSKIVDGNNAAVVSLSGTLQGLLTNDLNNVTVTATANYDNATVGTNKTITVVYVLGGSAAGNYIAPVDFLVTGAKITDITSGINEPKASDSEGITAYPSQVVAGQACTVKVTGMADSDLQGAVLCVYTMQGGRVYHSTKVELSNSIYLPSIEGIYLGRVTTTKGKEFQFKVIVTK